MNLSEPERERFEFGANWRAFLEHLDEERIDRAIASLTELIAVEPRWFRGKRFLDLGSGSGLFSLAAHRLAAEVVSIDYDADSVACTDHLRKTYATEATDWDVLRGSVLDESFMDSLGTFDVVYSWGVLHHTGEMWRAIDMACRRVRQGGKLAISIYNDEGAVSRRWHRIKRTHHALPRMLRPTWVALIAGLYETKFALARVYRGRSPLPFRDWAAKKQDRGMSAWHDWVDWVGGLPFEVATPQQIVDFVAERGLTKQRVLPIGRGWGCNEFVFSLQEPRESAPAVPS